jgi:WD40 repeat protein
VPRSVLNSPRARLERCWQANVDDYVSALAWSPDGNLLAVAMGSGPVEVLDTSEGRALHRLAGHGFGTLAAAWRPGSSCLATAGQDGMVRTWEAAGGRLERELEGGASWVERLAWSPDGALLAAAAGQHLSVWDEAGALVQEFTSPATIYDIAWRPGGRGLASAGYGGVWVWKLDRPEKVRHLPWKGASLRLAWSPSGEYIATGDQDATVHFWKVASGKDMMAQGYDTKVRNLAWDASSRYLATAGGSDVLVWDCSGKGPAGTSPRGMEAHEAPVSALAFQHRGPWLVSGDGQGQLVVWNPRLGPRTAGKARLGAGVTALAWAGDDRRFAVAAAGGDVGLHEVSQAG